MVEAEGENFDFGMSRSLEKSFLSIQFAFVHQWKYEWYQVIDLKLERTDLLSFAISQNQINLTNTLKRNANFYLPFLPDLNTVNKAIHKQQFHKHCKCQKQEPQTSCQCD